MKVPRHGLGPLYSIDKEVLFVSLAMHVTPNVAVEWTRHPVLRLPPLVTQHSLLFLPHP